MKRNHLKLAALALIVSVVAGCKQSESPKTGTINDLSAFARNFIGLNSSASTSLAPSRNGAVNQSFQGTMNNYLGATGQPTVSSDTSIISNPYPDCVKVTQTNNPDGSITVVTDYGTGCNQSYGGDYQSIQWGKYSSTYKNTSSQSGSIFSSQYFYRSEMDNFGGQYIYQSDTSSWSSNGHSTSTGESVYDTALQTFSGSNNFSDTSDYVYNKIHYSYRSLGTSTYSNLKSVQESNSYSYSEGNNYYQSLVTEPLVWNYACTTTYNGINPGICYIQLPVSGHEIVKYSQDGVQGEFEIDYGNGTCDNMMTVTENGKVIVIDVRDLPLTANPG